jgi:hypothetical protein
MIKFAENRMRSNLEGYRTFRNLVVSQPAENCENRNDPDLVQAFSKEKTSSHNMIIGVTNLGRSPIIFLNNNMRQMLPVVPAKSPIYIGPNKSRPQKILTLF